MPAERLLLVSLLRATRQREIDTQRDREREREMPAVLAPVERPGGEVNGRVPGAGVDEAGAGAGAEENIGSRKAGGRKRNNTTRTLRAGDKTCGQQQQQHGACRLRKHDGRRESTKNNRAAASEAKAMPRRRTKCSREPRRSRRPERGTASRQRAQCPL